MIIEGIITKVLGEETGISKQGKPWKKGNYVLTSLDRKRKRSCFKYEPRGGDYASMPRNLFSI